MATRTLLSHVIVLLLLCSSARTGAQTMIGPEGQRECDPVLAANGQTLYFTRPDHVRNQGTDDKADIWIRQRKTDGGWTVALNPGSPVNSFGDDRLLSCSVDGNRLAVLRGAPDRRVDLLERDGRNWRVIGNWKLPAEAIDPEELTFSATGQELIYSRRKHDGASSDLFLRRALPKGKWSAEQPLTFLNSPANESKPQLAADGRSLYFRRGGGKWFRQSDRGKAPVAVDIPSRFLQLAATDELLVATSDDLGQDERLYRAGVTPAALCPAGRISYGTLGNPPAPGRETVDVPLSSGTELRVRPDVLQRYAVVVREGEVPFPESAIPPVTDTRPAGSLASLRGISGEDREAYLRQSLEARQRELARLDQLRRQRYVERENYTNPPTMETIDTLPPADSTASFRSRYARELTELDRMKEKFRRQQEERLRERQQDGYVDLDWNEPEGPAPDSIRSVDTDDLQARVRSGLYPNQRYAPADRRPWENDIRIGSPAPPTALDAKYARQVRELEALRAQLREATGEARPADLQSKGDVGSAPEIYSSARPAVAVGITFIAHTAYLNSAGYEALDALAERVRGAPGLVEIRVHTAPDLERREAQRLSEERAVTIRNFLLEAGNHPENFRVVGYGNHQPDGGERVEIVE